MDYQSLARLKSLVRANSIPMEEREQYRDKLITFLDQEYLAAKDYFPFVKLLPFCSIEEWVRAIAQCLMEADENADLLKQLLFMQENSPALFAHSVRVSYLSLFILEQSNKLYDATIQQFQLYKTELTQMAVGGLLHDIGKLDLRTKKVIEKTKNMTAIQEQIYRNHVVNSNIVLKDKKLEGSILQGILQHHETCDGNGYPMSLSETGIGQAGKILAICNYYDHKTQAPNDKPIQDPLYVFTHLNNLTDKLSQNFISIFTIGLLRNAVGHTVKLNNGKTAILHSVNTRIPKHSTIDVDGKRITPDRENKLEIEAIL